MSRLVTELAPHRQALILPICDAFYPGKPEYEGLVRDIRHHGVEVYGLVEPFGVMPEGMLAANAEVFGLSSVKDAEAARELLVRTRAWLDLVGPRYGRIVFVTNAAMGPLWSQALRGPRRGKHVPVAVAGRITLIPAHRNRGMKGTIFRKRLLNEMTR